jgi:hypothetical protein
LSDFKPYEDQEPYIPEGLEYREEYWEDALKKLQAHERLGADAAKEEPFIPEGLEYQESYWNDALIKLEAHERFVARRRFWIGLAAAASLLFLLGGVWYFTQTSSAKYEVVAQADTSAQKIKTSDPNNSNQENISQENQVVVAGKKEFENDDEEPRALQNAIMVQKQSGSYNRPEHGITKKIASKFSIPETKDVRPGKVEMVISDVSGFAYHADSIASNGDHQSIDKTTVTSNDTPFSNSAIKESSLSVESIMDEISRMTPIQAAFFHPVDLRATSKLNVEKFWPIDRWNIRLDAGTILYNQFGATNRGKGFDVNAALMVDRNLTRRYSISSGLEYFQISGYHSPYSQSSVSYDFGANKTTITVDTKRLYYIGIPVEFKYRIQNRHQLMAGAGISYLLTGANELTTTSQRNQESQQLLSKESAMGYVKGFNSFTAFLQGGYQFWVNPRTSIGVRYCQGLSDVKRSDYYKDQIANRNNRLVVEIKYCLR